MTVTQTIEAGVATLTISREARRNALDNDTLQSLTEALDGLRFGETACLVITGSGGKSFCAGSDLKALAGYSPREIAIHTHLFQKFTALLDEMPLATVAAIEGFCLGGGLEIALACDYRVASSSSVFGFPEIRINAVASGGGTFRAARAMGLSRAREMLLFGRKIDAARAETLNLISEVVAPGNALAAAEALASDLAANVAAPTIAMVKAAILGGAESSGRTGYYLSELADLASSQTDAYKASITGFAKGGTGTKPA